MQQIELGIDKHPSPEEAQEAYSKRTEVVFEGREIIGERKKDEVISIRCTIGAVNEPNRQDGLWILTGKTQFPGSDKITHFTAVIVPFETSGRKDFGLLTIDIPE